VTGRRLRPVSVRLPNLLSASRALLALPVLAAGALGRRDAFFGLLAVALATEVDGTLARWLRAESDLGRRLDSWADLTLQMGALAGFAMLYPALLGENLSYLMVGGAALFVPIVYGLITRGEPLGYHTLLARGAGVLVGLAVITFLLWDTVALLRVSALLEVAVAIEYFTIAAILPGFRGEVSSIAAAIRKRNDSGWERNAPRIVVIPGPAKRGEDSPIHG
jgi:phosphatidylglycerophosphate synthase